MDLFADWTMIDLLCAVGLDLALGDPAWLPHPIRMMGTLIAFEEELVRKYTRGRKGLFVGGFLIVVINLLLAFWLPAGLLRLLHPLPLLEHVCRIYLLYTCLAARCLREEALKVASALELGIADARHRLSFIVGRETSELDEPDIIRATVETVAENTSDGVIAPLLYAMLGGAPLAMAYKMVNTMDSMLGYTSEKYRDLGFFPAKIDDLANYLPARLTGILMILGSLCRFHVKQGFTVMVRDRRNHKSPNCAYPEGAVAGLLGIQLGGVNTYFGTVVEKPPIGDPHRSLARDDIHKASNIMFRAEMSLLLIYLLGRLLVN